MDESTKQLKELIKSFKDSVQSQQLSLSIQLLKCPLCDFSSKYNSSLKKHVSSIHGDPETFCGICKEYFKRSMLQEHKQLIHSFDGKEFKCSLCGYSSKSNQHFGVSPPYLDEKNLGGFKLRVNTTYRKKK